MDILNNIYTIDIDSEEYPDRLRQIPDPPRRLFCAGDISLLREDSIAVVGSRKYTLYGKTVASMIGRRLGEYGIPVVSGLAYGIDAAGHEGCLKGGSPTVAVLGCGLDRTYPVGNTALKRQILEAGGAVISEFAPGEKPLGWHFPVRNRIISGLGEALIVMEARQRSGSLTTVQWALDQGKEVFVYPGDPEQEIYTEGNIQLLREGARLFTKAEHILEDLKWLDNLHGEAHNTESLSAEETMSSAERVILNALEPGALGMDALCVKTGLTAGEAMGAITMLQMHRKIEALPGKQYQIRRTEQEQ